MSFFSQKQRMFSSSLILSAITILSLLIFVVHLLAVRRGQ